LIGQLDRPVFRKLPCPFLFANISVDFTAFPPREGAQAGTLNLDGQDHPNLLERIRGGQRFPEQRKAAENFFAKRLEQSLAALRIQAGPDTEADAAEASRALRVSGRSEKRRYE
jgi:hypothetical protein